MTLLLGIDIGTSSAKAILFDADTSQTRAIAGHEYPIHKPAPDRAEQDPKDWWRATVENVHSILKRAEGEDIAAISFSGQMHGAVLLDRKNALLHPAIIWADQRSASMCEHLVAPFGPERYAAIAGTLPAAGFMGPTLLWLVEHKPQLLEQTHRVILPKDYLRLRMTGQAATEISDAAGSGVFDISKGAWSTEIIRAAGLPIDIFPPVHAASEILGELTPRAAEELDLRTGIPIVAGCADQAAQAIGNGLVTGGLASVTTGSGGQVFLPLHEINGADPRLHVFNHAAPGMWFVLGAILSAGLSLRWLRGLAGLAGKAEAYSILSAEAAKVPPGADGLIFLPYLSGERTPHMDPQARGGFIGLSYHHERGHLARAVMEGVAFALRNALEIGLSLGGAVDTVIAAGGGAESEVWRQIQADIFGVPLRQTLLAEQAGIGAALLGGVGVGIYANLQEACRRVVKLGPITEPNPGHRARYDELYARFQGLYPRLREDFHYLSSL